VTYQSLNAGPVLNDAGQVAYSAILTGPGVATANNKAIYVGSAASQLLVARTGDTAPGMPPGVTYSDLGATPVLNNPGHVAYRAILAGGELTSANNQTIYAGSASGQVPVARSGDHAPGTALGITYASLDDNLALNDIGQVAYQAVLSGSGVTAANDTGLFAYDPQRGNLLVAREGDPFDVGAGELRTVADGGISFLAGTGLTGIINRDGLGNDGTMAFSLKFTDGSSGMFTAAVPEPGTTALVALSGLSLLARRRRVRDPGPARR
jgi:hypothetical protein